MLTDTIKQIKTHLSRPQKSLLILHRSPDGDSVGSNMAMYHVLKALGHTVTVYSKDPVPPRLLFVPGADTVEITSPEEIALDQYDVYWGIDTAELHMTGTNLELPENLTSINIDHHISNPGWGSINLVDAKAAAAASVLFELFIELKIEITPDIATCLLTGLSTDSGFFQYSRNSKPFAIAAELIDKGAAFQKIVIEITKQYSSEDFEYIGKGLEQIQVDTELEMCLIKIPHDIYEAYCSDGSRSELLTPYLASVAGTRFGILITEKEPGSFRISFRAKDDSIDVSKIAQSFGGGGHKAAAGARIDTEDMDTVVAQILGKIKEMRADM